MVSEDAPLVADTVKPDDVMSDLYATNSARWDAPAAESTFLRSWSEPDKAVFRQYMAEQEALFKDWTLAKLTDKVARQSKLTIVHTVDKCCVDGGKLSLAAQLHGTLNALRKCQAAATVREQDEKEKLVAKSSNWLQVRGRLRFRVACTPDLTTDTLRLIASQSALKTQEQATPGLANGNAKKQPAAGGFLPLGGSGTTRGKQQQATATGKGALQLQPSRGGAAGAAFLDSVGQYQSSRGGFRSPGGVSGPPGLKPDQFRNFACACGVGCVCTL